MGEPAIVRDELIGRVLGGHPTLQGKPVRLDIVLAAQTNLRVGQRPPLVVVGPHLGVADVHRDVRLGAERAQQRVAPGIVGFEVLGPAAVADVLQPRVVRRQAARLARRCARVKVKAIRWTIC